MEYDAETIAYMNQMEADLQKAKLDATNSQNNYGQLSMYQSINPGNLAELQLDLAREKSLIEHVLRAHVVQRDKNGKEHWVDVNDPSRKIFSEYGVDRLMNFINIYVSLGTILSYYLPEEVLAKLKIISDELADIFFLEYEYLFYKPTLKEMIDFYGISKEDLEAMEQHELERVYNKLKFEADILYSKNKKQVYMIHNMLINSVHSAYNRALWGKERDSLRKMMHITESTQPRTNMGMPQSSSAPKFKWYNPGTW